MSITLEKNQSDISKPGLRTHIGITAPMLLNNIDTDQIIPSREIKKVSKEGLAEGLFAGQRYIPNELNERELNPDFILNQSPYEQASILLSRKNFGCGSSREHAVWALREYGFKVIIAESFGTIFRTNCLRNGVLPIAFTPDIISQLNEKVIADPLKNKLHVDVTSKTVTSADNVVYPFEIEAHFQDMLVNGLDFISLTLRRQKQIQTFIQEDKIQRSWAYLK